MIDAKPKVRIRKYSCYYCDCTGILTKKRVIFQILDWGYQYLNKKICYIAMAVVMLSLDINTQKRTIFKAFWSINHE